MSCMGKKEGLRVPSRSTESKDFDIVMSSVYTNTNASCPFYLSKQMLFHHKLTHPPCIHALHTHTTLFNHTPPLSIPSSTSPPTSHNRTPPSPTSYSPHYAPYKATRRIPPSPPPAVHSPPPAATAGSPPRSASTGTVSRRGRGIAAFRIVR